MRYDVPAGPERCGKNMTLGMGLGIFGAHDAGLDQPADVGMIPREPFDGIGADQIEATVADMREAELAVDDGQSSTGGPHAVELRMFHGIALNVLVSGVEGLDEGSLRIAAKVVVVDAAHGFDGEAAGFLSAFVAAHAIGNHSETAFAAEVGVGIWLPIEIGIFVISALAADVG